MKDENQKYQYKTFNSKKCIPCEMLQQEGLLNEDENIYYKLGEHGICFNYLKIKKEQCKTIKHQIIEKLLNHGPVKNIKKTKNSNINPRVIKFINTMVKRPIQGITYYELKQLIKQEQFTNNDLELLYKNINIVDEKQQKFFYSQYINADRKHYNIDKWLSLFF